MQVRRISRDDRDQRSSRCATGAPECKRTERRLGARGLLGTTVMNSAHISHSGVTPIPASEGLMGVRTGGCARLSRRFTDRFPVEVIYALTCANTAMRRLCWRSPLCVRECGYLSTMPHGQPRTPSAQPADLGNFRHGPAMVSRLRLGRSAGTHDREGMGAVRDQRDRLVRRPDDRGHERRLSGGDGVPGPTS